MIPSDHFVRFYNEVFKYLDARNGLQDYYLEISRHQQHELLQAFKGKGLQAVHDYYIRIYREENCEGQNVLYDHELILTMTKCPSLSKAINNDAGPCKKYCLHCPGWVMPLYQKAGLFIVFDLMGLDNPQCTTYLYDDIENARCKYQQMIQEKGTENILKNFD